MKDINTDQACEPVAHIKSINSVLKTEEKILDLLSVHCSLSHLL